MTKRSVYFYIKAGSVLILLVFLHCLPLNVLESLPAVCFWHNVFGIDSCPGCGMTRALLCLMHGDTSSALSYNKGVIIVAPLLIYIVAKNLTDDINKNHARTK